MALVMVLMITWGVGGGRGLLTGNVVFSEATS